MPSDIPKSMRAELSTWNNGLGIDLESWISGAGSFALAVGYAHVFCPRFEVYKDYVFREGGYSIDQVEGFETGAQSKAELEWVVNHLHIADIQYYGCPDATPDKLLILGNCLKEIYEAKLAWQFPDRKFHVRFDVPDDDSDLYGFQISFWQNRDSVT